MRRRYQSLIALGISSVILGGCTAGSGGFLNVGVVDALRKSKACVFKQKFTYQKTPIGKTGLTLPTFGTRPSVASQPVVLDSYSVPQTGTPTITSGCGCDAGQSIVSSDQQYYMPTRSRTPDVIEMSPGQIVEPSIDAVPAPLIHDAELPSVNPLPGDNLDFDAGEDFDSIDTEGSLEPIGQSNDTKANESDQMVDGQNGNDKSVFEAAKKFNDAEIPFNEAPQPTHAGHSVVQQKPEIVTLHARPAQSHNVFDRAAQQQKSLETMQASHKRNFRQQNALRQRRTNFGAHGYRQAMNTDQPIEFKPLPPVKQATPAPESTPDLKPKTERVPLPKTSRGTQQENCTRMANAWNDQTANKQAVEKQAANKPPRVPILRATTASSASILSLQNLANVINDSHEGQRKYDADLRTAQGSASTSVEVKSDEATIER